MRHNSSGGVPCAPKIYVQHLVPLLNRCCDDVAVSLYSGTYDKRIDAAKDFDSFLNCGLNRVEFCNVNSCKDRFSARIDDLVAGLGSCFFIPVEYRNPCTALSENFACRLSDPESSAGH